MSKTIRIIAADCETDPFKHKRDPEPFIWGTYDGKDFLTFASTAEFVEYIAKQRAIVYAHNGGKFDFMFLLQYLLKHGAKTVRSQIINGRHVKLMIGKAELRDSYAAIPIPLAVVGKLGIDYKKLERDVRHLHMPEIVRYLEQDCLSLYELMTRYRRIAGTQPTIASNAMKYCKNQIKINPGKSNAVFDEKFRPFYFGGRTECFRPGVHRNLHIVDIHSAYPYAMTHDHPSGVETGGIEYSDYLLLPKDKQQRCFLDLTATTKFGCFPMRKKDGGLEFPIGRNRFKITGWEFVAAQELNLLDDIEVHDIRIFSSTINFTPYIKHWYAYKDEHSAKDKEGNRLAPIEYEIGKRMQNALYGKLSQDPSRYYDYELHPVGTEVDRKNGWELADEYMGIEFHRRSALWKYQFEFGVGWRGRPLYNNVATGASITGFTRSHLLRAMAAIGFKHIIYCDTDSLMFDHNADYSSLPMSSKLGDWEYEQKGDGGIFVGKKLYAIRTAGKKDKIASKGGKLTYVQFIDLKDGKNVLWENDAPSFSIAGRASYVSRSFRSTASKALELN